MVRPNRTRRWRKIIGGTVLVIATWTVAFALGTGITALLTPWDELAQGVE